MTLRAFQLMPWNNRPSLPYLGPPRDQYRRPDFAIHTAPFYGWRWTIARQAWAIQQGFFVQRCASVLYDMGLGYAEYDMQRPILLSMSDCWMGAHPPCGVEQPDWHVVSWSKPAETMQTIKRHVRAGDAKYTYLLEFITQQDEHGYHNAWDHQVCVWNSTMSWFKHYVAEHKARMTPLYQRRLDAMARKREVGRH